MAHTALLLPPTAARSTPWQQTVLAPRQPVQTLAVRRGETALVEATQGRVWLTRDGQPLAGVEIELVPHGTYYRNDRRQTLLKTDAAGEVGGL
mgnify:CR=1 FL=1